jgi:hypothetical protein
MSPLFQETPLILQWLPGLSVGTVLFLNRLGQTVLIIIGAQAFYETHMYRILLESLQFFGKLDKYVYVTFSLRGCAVGFGKREGINQHEKNIGFPALLILSGIVMILTLFVSDHSPVYWLAYPFLQLWKAFTVWGGIRWDILAIIWTPIKSILFLMWTFMSLTLIITAITIPTKTLLVIAVFLAARFSPFAYKAMSFLAFVASAGLVLLTT